MIKKSEEQFDSGGIRCTYNFLMPFDETEKFVGDDFENIVDKFVEDASKDFMFELKAIIMWKRGYLGMNDNGKWVKEMKVDDITSIVGNYKTKYKEGFTGEEIEEFLSLYDNIDSSDFHKSMFGNTCMVIDNHTIYYHVDVRKSLRCILEKKRPNIRRMGLK